MLYLDGVTDVNRKCWCVTSKGMHAVGQGEVVVLLQCLPEEKSFPKDIFSHFIQLYRDCLTGQRETDLHSQTKMATHSSSVSLNVVIDTCHFLCISVGKVVKHLSLSLFGSSFLGSEEHAGFLYVRSTHQSLQGLPLPNQPYLFGLLVHRAEVAWAKAFPLRLMLRLGAEYRCKQGPQMKVFIYRDLPPLSTAMFLRLLPVYPCPLYSVRRRKPLFGEIGHTIMRLLVVITTLDDLVL